MSGAVTVVFVLLAVVGPLVLYGLVRSEHDARERLDREQAERAARRDIDTENGSSGGDRSDRRRNT